MKKKVLAVTLATVLALSLGLVMAVPAGASPGELVTNGGFETPDIGDNTYSLIADGTGTSWAVSWVVLHGAPPYLELQSGVAGSPYEGDQLCELGSTFATQISQSLSTVADGYYLLNFAFSPRPGSTWGTAAQAKMQVKWDGAVVDDLQRAWVGPDVETEWTEHSYIVQASTSSTTLMFIDTGTDDAGGPFLDAVSVLPISIEITKEADRTHAYEGDTINYLYRVHNDGDIPLGPVAVFDSLPITPTPVLVPPRPGFNIGDLNQNGVLDPCEEWQFTASYTVPDPCARTVIPNTGTAIAGTGYEPVTRVSAESNEVRVIILHPCIELEKRTTELAYFNGTEITYYYGVHNCGDTPLDILVVRDTTLGQDATPVMCTSGLHNRGDRNNNDIFEPCETWWFSVDHTLECPADNITYSDFCNTAMAGAFEPILESRVVVRDVTWTVRIFQWLPRTIGYWGNWDNHWSEDDMATLVRYVNFQSDYFGYPGDNEGWDLTYDEVHDLLLEKMKGKMGTDKAEKMLRKQLLAAWLSVKSYEGATDANDDTPGSLEAAMNPNATVYINGAADGTVEELLHRIENAIGSLDVEGLLLAKDILEKMNSAESNNYEMFLDPGFDPTAPCR